VSEVLFSTWQSEFINNHGTNNENDMKSCVEAFKKADTIRFTSMITKEEAMILQKLKEKSDYKLINDKAKYYQKFLRSFSSSSGKSFYNGDAKQIQESEYIAILDTKIVDDISGLKSNVKIAKVIS